MSADSTAEKATEKAVSDVSHSLESWFGPNLNGWPDNPTKFFGTPAREAVMAGRASRDAEVAELRAEKARQMQADAGIVRKLREQLAEVRAEVETRRSVVDEWIAEIIGYKDQLAEAQATIAAQRRIVFDPISDYYGELREKFEALSAPSLVQQKSDADLWDEGYDRGFYDRDQMCGASRDASEGASENPYGSLSAPSSTGGNDSQGVALIAAERKRQVTEEGYDAEHDKGHARDLVDAGRSYVDSVRATLRGRGHDFYPTVWPWGLKFWKPALDPVRTLVKAGSLIAAAIDSLLAKKGNDHE